MKTLLIEMIPASLLLAATLTIGLYYWLQFVRLCPTGCGI